MKLYEIIVANYFDDNTYNVLILSEENLTAKSSNINKYAGIEKETEFHYVQAVKVPTIKTNIWDVVDAEKCTDIKKLIGNIIL